MAEEQKPDTQEKAEEQKPAGQFIGGEVVIKADSVTGALSVNAPTNHIIALGLLEAGKVFIQLQMQDALRMAAMKRQPEIIKAGADALANLKKLSLPS